MIVESSNVYSSFIKSIKQGSQIFKNLSKSNILIKYHSKYLYDRENFTRSIEYLRWNFANIYHAKVRFINEDEFHSKPHNYQPSLSKYCSLTINIFEGLKLKTGKMTSDDDFQIPFIFY